MYYEQKGFPKLYLDFFTQIFKGKRKNYKPGRSKKKVKSMLFFVTDLRKS